MFIDHALSGGISTKVLLYGSDIDGTLLLCYDSGRLSSHHILNIYVNTLNSILNDVVIKVNSDCILDSVDDYILPTDDYYCYSDRENSLNGASIFLEVLSYILKTDAK